MESPTGRVALSAEDQASAFLSAAQGRPAARVPVWFMRQAGRSLPEYRAARAGIAMLDACLDPELAATLTLQPVERHGVDAAVLFSDIVIPLRLAGLEVEITPGIGPQLAAPIRSRAQVDALPDPDSADFSPIQRAAELACAALGGLPLLGFAGAPFTLASYLVEGGPSRDQLRTKALMFTEPATWEHLAAWTARASAAFLRAQIAGGARAVQVFDSWVGCVNALDYSSLIAPHSAALMRAASTVPTIHFATGASHLLTSLHDAGGTVMGIDHRADLKWAIEKLGKTVPVQGNLDPALLFAPVPVLHERAARIVQAGHLAPGHIFNLGHGVPPSADPGVLTDLVQWVHTLPPRPPFDPGDANAPGDAIHHEESAQ